MPKYLTLAILFLLAFVISSCTELSKNKVLDEGKIEFEISYPLVPEKDVSLEFFPEKMEYVFKDGSYRNDIEAGFGLFRTSFINKKDSDSVIQTLKFINSKFVCTFPIEGAVEDEDFQKIKVRHLKEKKTIAGYECKTAEVTVIGDSSWKQVIAYTNDLKVENPNRHSIFREINGVLMQYQLERYGTRLEFTAKKVYPSKVENSIDHIDEGYEKVSAERLSSEIKNIFAKLK